MPTYRMLIEYEGTNYHGWQVQVGQISIQEKIETALKVFCKEKTRIIAAGRTDAGVHAMGQVASFRLESEMDLHKALRSLNALTPPDIAVLEIKKAPKDFDARRWATGREYKYFLLNRPAPAVLNRRYFNHIPYALDFDAMENELQSLIGEHDFSSFRGSGCGAKTAVRTLRRADMIRHTAGLYEFVFYANGFLKHMIRNIMGTLIYIGEKKFEPGIIDRLLEIKDRTKAGPTAKASGLIFTRVDYTSELEPFKKVKSLGY